MPKNRPRCHCGGDMKRNGTTSKGTTRWRCKACGASSIKRRPDVTNARIFADFIEHCTTTISLTALAKRNNVSHSTMKRRFTWYWLIDVPDPTVAHTGRVYDQIFLDGTYTAGGCLIVASTLDHVVAWHWCQTRNRSRLHTPARTHPRPVNRNDRWRARNSKCNKNLLVNNTCAALPRPRTACSSPLYNLTSAH